MRELERIADELRRAYDGDAWHGPSVRAALDGVDINIAATRHVSSAHTIGELVLHMIAWTREVARRLRLGEAQEPEPGDWPTGVPADEAGWRTLIADFDAANAEVVEAIAVLDPALLDEKIGDLRDRAIGGGVTRYVTLHGLVQHHAYHAGQISLLKKAIGNDSRGAK